MDLKAFAVTPGLKHKFTGHQLAILGAVVGDDASVELTTVQQLLVQMDASRAEAARETLHAAGLKTYAVGAVVKNVRACSFCQGDEEEGYAVAVALDGAVAGLSVPFPLRVSYTGCPNGCAEPLLQDIGVVKTEHGFQVYGGGRANGLSPRAAVLIAEGIADADLPRAVRQLVLFYQSEGQGRERFWKFVDRVGVKRLAEATNIS
jgi:NAD(P)H-nitrite reductase large subunit